MPENDQNLEKWYESKLGFLAIVFFPILAGTITVVLYVAAIQTSIAVQQQAITDIKDNDLAHIEVEISEMKQSQSDEAAQTDKLNDKVVQALTILNQMQKNNK